jgi:hypothetical protein
MDRQRIKIYANKKHALVFYSGLFLFSTVFLIAVFFNDYSWFENGIIFILGILCFSVSLFGFFTLWSGRFTYFDPETEGFDKDTVFGNAPYLILEDRLQARMNANKIIFYADIIAVYAIPAFFDIEEEDEEISCYIVVKDKFNKKAILRHEDEYLFLRLFEKYRDIILQETPTVGAFKAKFNTCKRFFSSLLLHPNPARIDLCTHNEIP